MKKSFLLIFFLLSIGLFSQEKLIGNYCASYNSGYDAVCIEFFKNNRFEYRVSGCLGISDYGKGKFVLKKSELILKFDKIEQGFKSEIKISKISEKKTDSIYHKFKILDLQGLPLPVNVLKKSEPINYDKTQAGFDGNIIITNLKSNKPEKYEISFLGYERLPLTIENKNSQEITIKLAMEQPKPISGNIITLKVNEVKSEYFKVGKTIYKKLRN